MESLLGQFYSRIRGSQEDIASEGLVYILNRSKYASDALVTLVNVECGFAFSDLIFRTQVTGENLERPDISGYDETNTERIILEAKFWAALTDNQPNEYLRRLAPLGGALLFVCPSLRVGLLWKELSRRMQIGDVIPVYDSDRQVANLGNGCYVVIKTWDQILGVLKTALSQEKDTETREGLISDLNQIIGFCKQIDNESFLPIVDSDLSPSIGRRMYSYYSLVDKVLGKVISNGKVAVDTTGLRATPQRSGYVRYFKSDWLALFLGLNFEYWFSQADTPFWIGLHMNNSPKWEVTNVLRAACKEFDHIERKGLVEINGTPYFPLYPELNVTEDIVIEHLAADIELLIDSVSRRLPQQSDVASTQ